MFVSQVALVDSSLCTTLSEQQTVAMAFTALSACVDALLALELGNASSNKAFKGESAVRLLNLGMQGIGAVGEGLPRALHQGNDVAARELLTAGSLCAGQLADITPAPPTQVCHLRRDRAR